MTVVVDASVAIKWVVEEDFTDQAVTLRTRWVESGEHVIAPPIFRPEVTNVLHRRVRRGELGRSDAALMLGFLVSAVATAEPSVLYDRALTLAGELFLSTTYDALYVALAEAEGCEMWTADLKLVRAAGRRFPQLRSVTSVTEVL